MTMTYPKISILGAGTIGMSWAALFAATGREVTVYDPSPEVETRMWTFVNNASEALSALGWPSSGDKSNLRFTRDAGEAAAGADFIQENAPERLELKHALYREIEPHLKDSVIIGSSTSGLTLSQMQAGFQNPGRLILAHPFNPPHLIPLVELMDNAKTDPGILQEARAFYESIGKVCIRLNKEVPGHVANRLQAAIWREAIHLAMEGVASVKDIDTAVAFGPGLRWAAMGPNTLLHLGGGENGIRGFCDHLGGAFESWWDDLGTPRLTPEVVDKLEAGVNAAIESTSAAELAKKRDALLLHYILAAMDKRGKA